MPARDDYILRFVDLLRQAITESVRLRESGKHDQALFALMVAQEKLFARPVAQFAHLPLDEQLRLLSVGEADESARTKILGYAKLLREAGLVSAARDRPDLAASAFQVALHVSLSGVMLGPPPDERETELIRDLLARVPLADLQAPVREMLEKLGLPEREID